jgi:hypothetical protein
VPKLPGIPHLQAVRALEKAGFRVVRESKHIVMSNGQRILTIPRANPVNALTMGGLVRDAGLTIEESGSSSEGAVEQGMRSASDASPPYGTSTTEPVVRRASRSRCACAASASA